MLQATNNALTRPMTHALTQCAAAHACLFSLPLPMQPPAADAAQGPGIVSQRLLKAYVGYAKSFSPDVPEALTGPADSTACRILSSTLLYIICTWPICMRGLVHVLYRLDASAAYLHSCVPSIFLIHLKDGRMGKNTQVWCFGWIASA